jgi:hypothetical protein
LSGGDRAKKLFQFLNIIGARALGRHLGRVLEMAESSANKSEYETKIAKRFGFEQQLELPMPLPTANVKEAANCGGLTVTSRSRLQIWGRGTGGFRLFYVLGKPEPKLGHR